jgi:hypothetical protein
MKNENPKTQEIEVTAVLSVEVSTKYNRQELEELVRRNLMRAFPNNTRTLKEHYFKEEAEIYSNK